AQAGDGGGRHGAAGAGDDRAVRVRVGPAGRGRQGGEAGEGERGRGGGRPEQTSRGEFGTAEKAGGPGTVTGTQAAAPGGGRCRSVEERATRGYGDRGP